MTQARWDKIKSLFAAVMALSEPERAAFLDRECAGDAELRREVESLLAAGKPDAIGTADALRAAAVVTLIDSTQSAPITEKPGTRIGPYKLLQQIGEGGFGVVFMAEQEKPVRRRVALKIIKLGMDTRQVVARFEQERQALALMDHPNIAKVLDAGATESGRPYFVMEYVPGDPITHFADAHKLSVRERLELFAQVCSAVQHAHTKGVIHRDIKPRNVLVSMSDGRPLARVIDFGIAKATGSPLTDKTLFTEHRQLIGTPEYMSPEQAEGSPDIDTRTDVYALGVLLYELLTGATPFDAARLRSAAYAEMQRIIKEEDPPRPSLRIEKAALPAPGSAGLRPAGMGGMGVPPVNEHSARPTTLATLAAARQCDPAKLCGIIKGELDWIVMKSLDKDRARRYETPNQLAADVQRHLSGETVIAAPPSPGYRLRKFVRRHKGPMLAGSSVIISLVLGIIGTTVFMFRAKGETKRARLAEATVRFHQWLGDVPITTKEARDNLAAVLATRDELLGVSHIDSVMAAWRLAETNEARIDERQAKEAAAQRLERVHEYPNSKLLAEYAWEASFGDLDINRAKLWLVRIAKALPHVAKIEGSGSVEYALNILCNIGVPISRPGKHALTDDDVRGYADHLMRIDWAQYLAAVADSYTSENRNISPVEWRARIREDCQLIVRLANQMAEVSPDNPGAYAALAAAHRSLGEPVTALKEATRAINAPRATQIWQIVIPLSVKALALHDLGRKDEALATLAEVRRRVIDDQPGQIDIPRALYRTAELQIDPKIDIQSDEGKRKLAEASLKYYRWVDTDWSVGNLAASEQRTFAMLELQEAFQMRNELLGPHDPETIRALWALGQVQAVQAEEEESDPRAFESMSEAIRRKELLPVDGELVTMYGAFVHYADTKADFELLRKMLASISVAMPKLHADERVTLRQGPYSPNGSTWSSGNAGTNSIQQTFELLLTTGYHRLGDHANALAAANRLANLSTYTVNRFEPIVVAISAMSQWQLNRHDEARASLANLRELMKDPAWADDADAKSLTAEAEALIEGHATSRPATASQPADQPASSPASLPESRPGGTARE